MNAPATTGVRRWGAYLALVIVFAIACGLLSWWQWARRAETVAEIQRVDTNYGAAPVALDTLLPSERSWDEAVEWRPVTMSGHYIVDKSMLVRARPRDGQPGFEQLVPLELSNGTVFFVDRGWLPVGTIDLPDHIPTPPSGDLTIVARLQKGEPTLPGRSAPKGQLATINLPEARAQVGEPAYTGGYGLLATESPAVADLPAAAEKPIADEGPHLSYAVQWIAFGVLAFIGLYWAFRRERRIAALPEEERHAARNPKRRSEDIDEEDAILDRRT